MTDDRVDREFADRLSAYESRLPDAAPPAVDASNRHRTRRLPLIGVGVLAAVAGVLAVAVLLNGMREDIGDASPSPSPSAGAREPAASVTSEPSAPALSQSPSAASSPSEPTADLRWTEVARFGSPDDAGAIRSIARHETGLVAVGVAYQGQLPILGPTPPHEGRVWLSADGTSWEDATPADTLENAELRFVIRTADGGLIAHGWAGVPDEELGIGVPIAATWESADGRSWTPSDQPFGDDMWPMAIAQGAQGSVATVLEPAGPTLSIWWSPDGRTWERVHDLGAEGGYSAGAGDEGFVIAGSQGAAQEPFAIASGDGREWVEAGTPPGVAVAVAPVGGDWLAVSRDATLVVGEPSEGDVWTSANGLDWSTIGAYPLANEGPSGAACTEIPTSLFAAGPWLVSGTVLSFGCSEGGVQTMGAQLISLDGADWTALPFAAPAEEVGLGTRISGALEVDGRLVLIGERDRIATIWVGEQP